MSDKKVGAVLVVGGGIGGIQASLDLADSGFKVYLIDSSPAIGGVMSMLDKTFPTNDCSMCIMAPKLVTCGRHLNIDILANSDVKEIKGESGNFEVSILKRARYVDIEKCTGCGVCAAKCPSKIPDEYNQGLCKTRSMYIPYPQAVPLAAIIDKETCIYFKKGKCRACEKLCTAGAINFEDKDEEISINVGSVILSPGYKIFEAEGITEYGYGRFANVITALEFERMLAPTGPHQGHLYRPSNEEETPNRIAFIQCVGSRDTTVGNDYCSSVCCMYATKAAVIAREHQKGIEANIFYMDMRAYGKDFDKYIDRAKDEFGVKFIRSRVSEIVEVPESKNLKIRHETEKGESLKEEFDLVVLSVGLCASKDAMDLAKRVGVGMNDYGFCQTSSFAPVDTSRKGIFVAGCFQGPKDIPETVAQASGAAGKAGAILSEQRGALVTPKEYPEEDNVTGLPPRIGAFICHCGINIAGVVDIPDVVEYVKTLPNVVYAENNLYTCSQNTQEKIKAMIEEHNLNRVFVAACSPRTHEPLFQETIRESGLNPYLFEMANIRDQCSWVHMNAPEAATVKAKELIRMGLSKARYISPLERVHLPVISKALVVGGGLSGMVTAKNLAEQGFEVHLVEREDELGGNLRYIHYTLEGLEVETYLGSLIKEIEEDGLIKIYLKTSVESIKGFVGDYKTKLGRREKGEGNSEETHPSSLIPHPLEIEHGVVVVATGAREYEPSEYLYGQDERILTQRELEERLANHQSPITNHQSVVMIQCVGSRDKDRPYCSRYCCQEAVKNALKIKELSPETDVYILYRDMRTYGFMEEYYKKAREAGVVFIRYDEENKPEVKLGSREQGAGSSEETHPSSLIPHPLEVEVYDPIVRERLVLSPDLVVLSAAIIPQADNKELAQMLKVPLNAENFFLEAHAKLRPVEFATDGVFLAGLAHGPKNISEAIAQANAAASRATVLLGRDHIEAEGQISRVDIYKCSACGMCLDLCAYKAIEVKVVNERTGQEAAQINEALCKGCGACAANCRCGAIDVSGFTSQQLASMLAAV